MTDAADRAGIDADASVLLSPHRRGHPRADGVLRRPERVRRVDQGLPAFPRLVEGFSRIRSDEGRHVGFGIRKLKELVAADAVDPSLRHDLTGELAMLVQEAVATAGREGAGLVTPDDLSAYAAQKHAERMDQIVDVTADVPDVEALACLDE